MCVVATARAVASMLPGTARKPRSRDAGDALIPDTDSVARTASVCPAAPAATHTLPSYNAPCCTLLRPTLSRHHTVYAAPEPPVLWLPVVCTARCAQRALRTRKASAAHTRRAAGELARGEQQPYCQLQTHNRVLTLHCLLPASIASSSDSCSCHLARH